MPSTDASLLPGGNALIQAFELLVTTFRERGIRYAIIGGIAILQHTRARTTDDIDALIAVPQIALPGLLEALQSRGFSIDLVAGIKQLRDHGLTTLRYQDVLIDLMQPLLPAHAHVLDHAVDATVLGQAVRISSAEGLIVLKMMAMRPQDQADIRELLAAYGESLDLKYVRAELDTFSDASDPRRSTFESWVKEATEGL